MRISELKVEDRFKTDDQQFGYWAVDMIADNHVIGRKGDRYESFALDFDVEPARTLWSDLAVGHYGRYKNGCGFLKVSDDTLFSFGKQVFRSPRGNERLYKRLRLESAHVEPCVVWQLDARAFHADEGDIIRLSGSSVEETVDRAGDCHVDFGPFTVPDDARVEVGRRKPAKSGVLDERLVGYQGEFFRLDKESATRVPVDDDETCYKAKLSNVHFEDY